jgi:hypothetical protein
MVIFAVIVVIIGIVLFIGNASLNSSPSSWSARQLRQRRNYYQKEWARRVNANFSNLGPDGLAAAQKVKETIDEIDIEMQKRGMNPYD